MIIMGIDPGIATTGYGLIKTEKRERQLKHGLECLAYGCIKTTPGVPTGDRLKKINNELNKLIKNRRPDIILVENIYFFKNLKTAIPVSQAKGVILLTAAKNKVPVFEITPLEMKMAIVGYGRADKKQVKKMVEKLLDLKEPVKSDDAADALGLAICGAFKKFL